MVEMPPAETLASAGYGIYSARRPCYRLAVLRGALLHDPVLSACSTLGEDATEVDTYGSVEIQRFRNCLALGSDSRCYPNQAPSKSSETTPPSETKMHSKT